MLDSQIFIRKLVLMSCGVGLMTLLVTSVKADDEVTRYHIFDLDQVEEVEFSNNVGRIEIIPVEGSEMRIVMDIEGNRHGIFRRKVNVDNMDLEVKERGDTLFLSFEEENTKAEWVIEMPTVARTIIEMGVGELKLEIGATDLDIELGVGDVTVIAPEANVGRININVGVGDANIRVGEILADDSVFISQSIRAQGDGDQPLEIDLGVGEVKLRLE
ncbi:MAG: hypothetical protein P8M72_04830 [Gammaproteobacteria bacterium]|nr:hypothetical protein [Gammaproteobacteria bacterium]